MRSGFLYRLGMTVVITSSLVGLWTLFFPDSLGSAMNAVSELASGESGTEEVAQSATDANSNVDGNVDANVEGNANVDVDADVDVDVDLRIDSKETIVDSRVRWAITVTNDGPADEVGPVTLRGTLPPTASYVSFSGRDWLCTELDGALVCNLSSALPAGHQADLILLADTAPGDQPYTAAVAGVRSDTDLANNVIGGNWVLPEGVKQPTDEAAAGASSTGADRAAADNTDNTDDTDAADTKPSPGQESLPRTGAGSTIVLTVLGLVLCFAGIRLTRMVPSFLEEFRQGPLWPGA